LGISPPDYRGLTKGSLGRFRLSWGLGSGPCRNMVFCSGFSSRRRDPYDLGKVALPSGWRCCSRIRVSPCGECRLPGGPPCASWRRVEMGFSANLLPSLDSVVASVLPSGLSSANRSCGGWMVSHSPRPLSRSTLSFGMERAGSLRCDSLVRGLGPPSPGRARRACTLWWNLPPCRISSGLQRTLRDISEGHP
jgi:hypothetical protein